MVDRERVIADDVATAVGVSVAALRPATDRDWSAPAGSLEWSCRRTAEHVADCLLAYAAQLAVAPPDHWVAFRTRATDDASPALVLEFVEASGRILVAMLRQAPEELRAYLPDGTTDPEGMAAAACVEALVHGHDIATGLGVPLDAPPDLCARVLGRWFSGVEVTGDPWATLLWSMNRVDLPDRPRAGDQPQSIAPF